MSLPRPRRQSGVALLTAMLITVIATIAAVAMASRQHLDLRRTMNVVEYDQAYLFSLGVESWAKEVLVRDRQEGHIDHPAEAWSTILPPIEVEGATVSGWIEDMQGRFNLNNLVDATGGPSTEDIARFRRLLRTLEVDERLADPVVDWIDPDIEPRFPDGAEDETYTSMEPPYRTANSPMAHPSELLLVNGFTTEIFEILRPHVQALPERTTINVNTATVAVLMSLDDNISESDAEQLIEDRGEEGYQRVEDFMDHPVLMHRQLTVTDLGIASGYFMINGNVRFGRSEIDLQTLVVRTQDTRVSVVRRSQGGI